MKVQARVIETLTEGVSVYDEDGFILYTNSAEDAMFGYEPGELIGQHISVLNAYPAEESARMIGEIAQQLSTQGWWCGEFSNRKKDGTTFTSSARISAQEISGEKYWVSVQQDITERKRAEKVQEATYLISEATNAAESLDALYRSIHKIVGELLPVPNFYIALYDESSETFSFPYFVDECSAWPSPRRLGKGLTEYTFRTGQPVSASPQVLEELIRSGEAQLSGAPAVDWFGVPLKIKEKAIGVLVVQSYTEGVTLGEHEKSMLVFVSEQIAMAIERKRAEEELRKSQANYAALVNSVDGIVWEADATTFQFSFVSKQAERLLGYPVERWINEPNFWAEHIHPDDRAWAVDYCVAATTEARDHQFEYRMIAADGKTIWLSDIVTVVVEDGSPAKLRGVMFEVTERKRAEADRLRLLALEREARNEAERLNSLHAAMLEREREARAEAEAAHREWQATFDAMTDLVFLVDRDDHLVRANNAFYEKLGRPPEAYHARAVSEVLHSPKGTLADGKPCPLCTLRSQAKRKILEIPAGVLSDYPILASTDPIFDSDGNTVGVIQVVRDQTELYRARQEAERERLSLAAIVEQMAEGLLVWDEKMRLVRANPQAQLIYGFTFEQMRDDHTFSLLVGRFTDDDGRPVPVADLPLQTAMRERRVADTRLWYTRPDGERVYLSLTASPIFNDRKKLAGAILVARDITLRQREANRAQQADKLRALGQLASGVAHNFNNALAAVIGYTQLAMPKVNDPNVEKYLKVVEQSAKDAARMVERIQNFSRGSRRTDDFVRMRLSDIVRDAIDITRPRWRDDAEAAGIKYSVQLRWQPDEDLVINGAPSELREVFVNIILNALDAMIIGGTLSIDAAADQSNVSIRFTDTGIGMTDEIRRQIFDPFFTTKGTAGLGMGLSESYRIIERHGGRIEVESQPHRGTTFIITLPRADSAENESSDQMPQAAVPASRILIIDDEEPIRRLLAEILGQRGHRVSTASSAEEAMRLVEAEDFDLVFTDLAMPKTDGVTTAAEIKSRKPSTRIVLMTGYGTERAHERAGESSCIDYALSKPFRLQDLNDAIRTLLSS